VLQYLGDRSDHPGDQVGIGPDDFVLFDAKTPSEVTFHLESLIDQGLIRRAPGDRFVVTSEGWKRLSSSAPGGTLGTCFVAMSFDPSLNEFYDNGMVPAIRDCGFAELRVDRVEHNDNITDRILAGIRSAQFMVADFTLQRQGVYYEAGFAQGLGRIVVWTCRDTDRDNLHFDTRQMNHVIWTDAADLRRKLTDRIRATITLSAPR